MCRPMMEMFSVALPSLGLVMAESSGTRSQLATVTFNTPLAWLALTNIGLLSIDPSDQAAKIGFRLAFCTRFRFFGVVSSRCGPRRSTVQPPRSSVPPLKYAGLGVGWVD